MALLQHLQMIAKASHHICRPSGAAWCRDAFREPRLQLQQKLLAPLGICSETGGRVSGRH